MGIKAFQKDLNNGMTITEALQKHNLTFKETCDRLHDERVFPSKYRKQPIIYTPTGIPNIYNINNKYYIKKTIKGKSRIYGSYNTLEDAIRMKQALIKDGWHQTHVDKLCQELGIERNVYFNNKVRYH
jgi:hypothetical protein